MLVKCSVNIMGCRPSKRLTVNNYKAFKYSHLTIKAYYLGKEKYRKAFLSQLT